MKYWVLVKKNTDRGVYVPTYEIHASEPPEGKMVALEPGECIDVFKCALSTKGDYISVSQFTISNLDSMIDEKLTESYIIRVDENTN